MRFLLSKGKAEPMKTKYYLFIIVLGVFCVSLLPSVFATPSVEIIMEKNNYKYCDKLFYTIKVSEITGDSAIIHIRDQKGTSSNAIPIPINNLQNPIPSTFPFEAEIFPLGKYFIDVEYSGAENSTEFDLVDSKNICIPGAMKQIAYSWISNQMSDGYFIDAINKFVNKDLIKVPDKINEKKFENIHIPRWVKNTAAWWLEDKISDNEFSQAIQYLINREIIVIIIPFAYSALNIYAVEQLHFKWGEQKMFNYFELSNNGNVEFCNAMPYWTSFKKFEIITFYDFKNIGVFTVQPLTINPSSHVIQKGTFHSEEFTESQYLFMQLDFEFNGGDIRIDPNKMYVLVNIDTPIIGVIPHTTTIQYNGFDFYNIMNDKNSECK